MLNQLKEKLYLTFMKADKAAYRLDDYKEFQEEPDCGS